MYPIKVVRPIFFVVEGLGFYKQAAPTELKSKIQKPPCIAARRLFFRAEKIPQLVCLAIDHHFHDFG
jgi:hypothetical protein